MRYTKVNGCPRTEVPWPTEIFHRGRRHPCVWGCTRPLMLAWRASNKKIAKIFYQRLGSIPSHCGKSNQFSGSNHSSRDHFTLQRSEATTFIYVQACLKSFLCTSEASQLTFALTEALKLSIFETVKQLWHSYVDLIRLFPPADDSCHGYPRKCCNQYMNVFPSEIPAERIGILNQYARSESFRR